MQNRYEKARTELRAYFAAYGDEFIKQGLCATGGACFTEYGKHHETLQKRSREACAAFQNATWVFRRVMRHSVTIEEFERAAISMIDVLEGFGAEWEPEHGELE